MAIKFFIFLTLLTFQCSSSLQIEKVFLCPSFTESLSVKVGKRRSDNRQNIAINMTTSVDLGANTNVKATVQVKRGKDKWAPILNLNHEKGFCDYLNTYLGPMASEIKKEMKIPVSSCPIPKGTYILKDYLIDYRKLLIKTLPFGKIKHTIDIYDKEDIVEESNSHLCRKVIRVLYDVLEHYPWYEIEDELMDRLLNMYHKTVVDEDENESMKKGLEMCIRRIMDNLDGPDLVEMIKIMLTWCFEDDLPDQSLLDFGNVLEYGAIIHDTSIYHEAIPDDVFPMVLKLIASDNVLRSLLGNRVLQHLLDRNNNRLQFDTPRLFFEGTHFNVKMGDYQTVDKIFMKKYREMIHTMLLTSVELHGCQRINLESTYTSIALILVEVPCGFTAAAMVCLAMAIQENTLADELMELESSHRLHATVMSIMSLVCWVHQATVFYEYLNTVIARRAELAPHLNPPLKASYEYAQHYVLWNKPELFFEDWEARYGLWKCFKIKTINLERR